MEDQPSAYGDEYGVQVEPGTPAAEPVVAQRRLEVADHVGRNEPCWCGSGKKFKKCHGA